jgi:CRP-like cAMP-binding protein
MCSDNADGSEMVFKGLVQSNQLFTAGEIGLPVYLSISGTLSSLKPTSSGEWVRLIGYIKSTDGLILLDVSNDFYQVP